MPTPMNSVTPFSRQQSLFSSDGNANTADQAKSVFIPKFKLDDLNTSASFGEHLLIVSRNWDSMVDL